MRVIKRSGSEVEFDITKIIAAVNKANATVSDDKKLTKEQITELAADVEEVCKNIERGRNTGYGREPYYGSGGI